MNFMPMPANNKTYLEQCLGQLRSYCAYQERTINEVRIKLFSFQLDKIHNDKIIKQLIKEDYINEERYARVFAVSKLRANKWGRKKIFYALSEKRIPEIFIEIGLSEINEEEYLHTIRELIKKKRKVVKETDNYKLNNKIAAFLISKGFEPDLIWRVINFNH